MPHQSTFPLCPVFVHDTRGVHTSSTLSGTGRSTNVTKRRAQPAHAHAYAGGEVGKEEGGDLDRLEGCIEFSPLRGRPAAGQVQQLCSGREGVSVVVIACRDSTHCTSPLMPFAHTTSCCRLHSISGPVEAAERTPRMHKLVGSRTISSKAMHHVSVCKASILLQASGYGPRGGVGGGGDLWMAGAAAGWSWLPRRGARCQACLAVAGTDPEAGLPDARKHLRSCIPASQSTNSSADDSVWHIAREHRHVRGMRRWAVTSGSHTSIRVTTLGATW